jgi:hypothetical protein
MERDMELNFRYGPDMAGPVYLQKPLTATSPSLKEYETVKPTPVWRDYYGDVDLPGGSLIEAYDEDDVLCGIGVVRKAGQYGFLHVYGDDPETPEDEGAKAGDVIRFDCDGTTLATTRETGNWQPLRDAVNLHLTGETGTPEDVTGLPLTYGLSPLYPNPFNSSTMISYQLPEDGLVRIDIFNIMGQRVRTIVHMEQRAGYQTATWNASNDARVPVSSGIYFVRFVVHGHEGELLYEEVRKTLLME